MARTSHLLSPFALIAFSLTVDVSAFGTQLGKLPELHAQAACVELDT